MKKNFFFFLCGLFMFTALFSCTDDNFLGLSLQPDKDKISVAFDTVHVKSETVLMDSVYLRNSVALLGEFTDTTFGTTKSDFMAQLYSARKFAFPDDVTHIDSAYIYFYYNEWFGDSTEVQYVNVYELSHPLDMNTTYYSNTDVRKYCDVTDQSKFIAEGAFTAGDLYSSDSVRALSSYSPAIKLPLSSELATRFLNEYKTHPESFATPEAFRNFFKGIYVTTGVGNEGVGNGSILYITHAGIELCFDTWLVSHNTGYRDSMVVGAGYFPVTQEVKQVNKVEHRDLSRYIRSAASDTLNYIYSPGGLFTKVTIPERIFQKGTGVLSGKTISTLNLEVMATQVNDQWEYAMNPPEALLLINIADAQTFFKKYELNDGINSFLATYDSDNQNYVFDLSVYAQKMIHKMDGTGSVENFTPFTEMIMIPVNVVQDADGDNVRIDHVMTPSAVKVRSGNHETLPMKLNVLYTKSK